MEAEATPDSPENFSRSPTHSKPLLLKNGKNYTQSPSCLLGLSEIMIGSNNGTFYMPESVLDTFIFKLCK